MKSVHIRKKFGCRRQTTYYVCFRFMNLFTFYAVKNSFESYNTLTTFERRICGFLSPLPVLVGVWGSSMGLGGSMGLQSNPSIRKLFIYDLFDCAFKFLGIKVRRMLKLKFFFGNGNLLLLLILSRIEKWRQWLKSEELCNSLLGIFISLHFRPYNFPKIASLHLSAMRKFVIYNKIIKSVISSGTVATSKLVNVEQRVQTPDKASVVGFVLKVIRPSGFLKTWKCA